MIFNLVLIFSVSCHFSSPHCYNHNKTNIKQTPLEHIILPPICTSATIIWCWLVDKVSSTVCLNPPYIKQQQQHNSDKLCYYWVVIVVVTLTSLHLHSQVERGLFHAYETKSGLPTNIEWWNHHQGLYNPSLWFRLVSCSLDFVFF